MEVNFNGEIIAFSPHEFVYITNVGEVNQPSAGLIYRCESNVEAQQLKDLIDQARQDYQKEAVPSVIKETIQEVFEEFGDVYFRKKNGWNMHRIVYETRKRIHKKENGWQPSLSKIEEIASQTLAQKAINEGVDLIATRHEDPLRWVVVAPQKTAPHFMAQGLTGEYLDTVEPFDETRTALWEMCESFGITICFEEFLEK